MAIVNRLIKLAKSSDSPNSVHDEDSNPRHRVLEVLDKQIVHLEPDRRRLAGVDSAVDRNLC
jgi:hypothetical protein